MHTFMRDYRKTTHQQEKKQQDPASDPRLGRAGIVLFLLGAITLTGQTPNAEDLIWQKSVSKFDGKRAELLKQVDRIGTKGPFQPNWDSLTKYQIPEWYQDAKFGIFIHWGLYSVPAFGNEWYPRNMYDAGSKEYKHQVQLHGPETAFGYKEFIPSFQAEKFDAKAWAKLFADSGAKYVVPVAEHHDGFAMYNSDLSDWTAAKMGPKRDIIGELAPAIRAQGLHFGASSHRIEHYFFMNNGREHPSDVQDPKFASFYGPAHAGVTNKNKQEWAAHPDEAYLNDWLARTTEIVNKYQPEIIWFDWWIKTKEVKPYLQRFASFYYNDAARRNSTAAINYKFDAYPDGAAVLDIERGQLDASRKLFWQTDTSISEKSWGYIANDTFRSPESLIQQLVDIVSKNGCLLLNIGPKPDGTIPDEAAQILRQMGKWLAVNGEAIYGTRPWTTFGEGPTKVVAGSFKDTATQPYSSKDIRFTTHGKTLYAIAMAWPQNGTLVIQSLGEGKSDLQGKIANVSLLGSDSKLKWTRDGQGLTIQLPKEKSGEYAFVLKIT